MHEDREQFTEAIHLAVFKTGMEPQIIEKDYYVTLILKKLAEKFSFVVFKGGIIRDIQLSEEIFK